MASISIRTQPLTRAQLSEVLGNPRLVKLLENLAFDMTVNVPEAINIVEADGDNANALASLAQSIAIAGLALGRQATEGPPVLPVVIPDIPEDARVVALESRLATLEKLFSELQGDPTP